MKRFLQESTLTVLYQDNHLIAVYKPPGLLTQGDSSGQANLLDDVKAWLAATYQKPGNVFLGMVHRLDRPVSGVVLFAKTSKAAARVSHQFRERQVEKIYRAQLEGRIEPAEGSLVHYCGARDASTGTVAISSVQEPDLKQARLHYRTLWNSAEHSVVEIRLETGRKHQIRAQFAYTGHPVAGDRRYGASRPFDALGGQRTQAIGLVAVRLSVEHPISKERLIIELPEALCAVQAQPPAARG
jgi:23S rRNA pseudouridine1911/1915/1917 synthase